MRGAGTDEPWFGDDPRELDEQSRASRGRPAIAMQWRKPLSFAEVAQMAPTPEVRARPGRA